MVIIQAQYQMDLEASGFSPLIDSSGSNNPAALLAGSPSAPQIINGFGSKPYGLNRARAFFEPIQCSRVGYGATFPASLPSASTAYLLEALAYLVTPATQNLFANSTAPVTGFSTLNRVAVTNPGVFTAPDGSTTGVGLLTSAAGTTTYDSVQGSISTPAGVYTLSIYAKAGSQAFIGLAPDEAQPSSLAIFGLSGVGSVAFAGASVISSSIQGAGNGWYRCSVTAMLAAGLHSFSCFMAASGAYPGGIVYTTGGGDTSYVWGPQFEAGQVPTGYRPQGQNVNIASLVDAAGTNVMSIDLSPTGQLVTRAQKSDGSTATATSSTSVSGPWLYLAASYSFSDNTVTVYISAPGGSTASSAVLSLGGLHLKDVAGLRVHADYLPSDGIDSVKLTSSTAAGTQAPPPFPVIASGLFVRALSSNSCDVDLLTDGVPAQTSEDDMGDALNRLNWTCTGADGSVPRVASVAQATPGENGRSFTVTLQEPLTPGVTYTLAEQNLLAFTGGQSIQSQVGTFAAFAMAVKPPDLATKVFGVDIANRSPDTTGLLPPGDYVVDSTGDFGTDSGLATIQKRCLRRLITPPGGFSGLPNYGIGVANLVKQLQTAEKKRLLLDRIKKQIPTEAGVLGVDVLFQSLPNNLARLTLTMKTKAGEQALKYTFPR